MLDAKFFLRVGPIVRDKYRKHIFKDAKDVYDKKFKGYSKEYGEAKRADTFKGQSSQYKDSLAPVLTSALLTDYSLIRTSSGGFQIGWIKEGAKVNHLAKLGRFLTADNQPLPDKVIQYLSREAGLYINKKMPKGTKTYRIGK